MIKSIKKVSLHIKMSTAGMCSPWSAHKYTFLLACPVIGTQQMAHRKQTITNFVENLEKLRFWLSKAGRQDSHRKTQSRGWSADGLRMLARIATGRRQLSHQSAGAPRMVRGWSADGLRTGDRIHTGKNRIHTERRQNSHRKNRNHTKGRQVAHKTRGWPRMVRGWSADGLRMVRGWSRMVRGWSADGLRTQKQGAHGWPKPF